MNFYGGFNLSNFKEVIRFVYQKHYLGLRYLYFSYTFNRFACLHYKAKLFWCYIVTELSSLQNNVKYPRFNRFYQNKAVTIDRTKVYFKQDIIGLKKKANCLHLYWMLKEVFLKEVELIRAQ